MTCENFVKCVSPDEFIIKITCYDYNYIKTLILTPMSKSAIAAEVTLVLQYACKKCKLPG